MMLTMSLHLRASLLRMLALLPRRKWPLTLLKKRRRKSP
jgi:hypothetical protein